MHHEMKYQLDQMQQRAGEIETLVAMQITRADGRAVPMGITVFAGGEMTERKEALISEHLWRIAEILTGRPILEAKPEFHPSIVETVHGPDQVAHG